VTRSNYISYVDGAKAKRLLYSSLDGVVPGVFFGRMFRCSARTGGFNRGPVRSGGLLLTLHEPKPSPEMVTMLVKHALRGGEKSKRVLVNPERRLLAGIPCCQAVISCILPVCQ
jgi:hypothetical protein